MNPLFNQLQGNKDLMSQLQSNPIDILKKAGYNVPKELSGNPQAMVMHLLQSGQIANPMMQSIQPILNSLMKH